MPRPSDSRYPKYLELDICEAITRCCLLAFDYNGIRRVVQPYCHGFTRTGGETLRAIEVGTGGRVFGKLWTVAKMKRLRLNSEHFIPDDPDYNPNDSSMVEIHCRVKPRPTSRGHDHL